MSEILVQIYLKLNFLYSGIVFDVAVKLNANRRVTGVLRGFDPFMNLVIDEAVEEAGPNKNEIGMVVSDYMKSLMVEMGNLKKKNGSVLGHFVHPQGKISNLVFKWIFGCTVAKICCNKQNNSRNT